MGSKTPIYSMGLYRISKYVEATYLLVNQRKKKKEKKKGLNPEMPASYLLCMKYTHTNDNNTMWFKR